MRFSNMFLKCTWDFVSIRVRRDQQIGRGLPLRRETVAPSSQEEWRAAPCRATRGSSRRQKACRESRCQGLYHGFHRKQWVTQDGQMGPVGVNDLTALWGVGTTPSRLVPGSRAVWGQGERVARPCWPQSRQSAGKGFGLVGLHMKSTLTGESFSVSRNEPAVGGTSSPGSATS